MIRADGMFLAALPVSLAAHALLIAIWVLLPSAPPPPEMVRVYSVRIMEAPPRPQVRHLELSTRAISELRLEAPTLSLKPPPVESPAAPALDFPLPPPVPAAPAPGARAAPAAPVPVPAGRPPAASRPALVGPQPPGVPPPAAPVPAAPLPKAPLPKALLPSEPPPQAARPEVARPSAPPAVPGEAPPISPPALPAEELPAFRERRPMEELRPRVERLSLRIEESAPAPPEARAPLAPAAQQAERSSLLAFRKYQGQVQSVVKQSYTYPGGFDPRLTVRVRVVIGRDGLQRSVEVLQSSGDSRFDYAVQLTLRSSRFPPIPEEVPGETITQTFVFSPRP